MRVKQLGAAFAALSIMASAGSLAAAPASAEPARADVSLFVGYDTFRAATLSPDGRYVAGVLRDAEGDLLIIHDRTTKTTRPIQRARADQNLELASVQFKGNDRLVFGLQQKFEIVQGKSTITRVKDEDSDEGFSFVSRVYASKLDGTGLVSLYDPALEQGFPRWLSAGIDNILPDDPDHVLIRTPSTGGTQLRKVDIRTGKYTLVETGSSKTISWLVDSNLKPVMRVDSVASGRGRVWSRRDASGKWAEVARYMGADNANSGADFEGLGRGPRPDTVIVRARTESRDTVGLYVYNTSAGKYEEELYTNDKWDVSGVIRSPSTAASIGACFLEYKVKCIPSDEKFASHWLAIEEAVGPDSNLRLESGGSLDGFLMVSTDGPKDPGTFYIYDTKTRSLEVFQTARAGLDTSLMPSATIMDYTAKDGTEMWGYLWLPPGATVETRNLPTIVLPHGGPESRDAWGFDPLAGYWAAQGYAVFQPHFRGGAGSGRGWVEAGHGQWGQLIQEDINDGTRALISKGIADANRICIAGWSHGGYVAFTASYRDTELYKCSLAGAGVSDLRDMQSWVRKEQGGTQSTSYKYWAEAIGDPNADAAKLDKYSARRHAAEVGMPLLIVHGELDYTVPVEQSRDMVTAMKKANKPYEYVEIKDMDHYLRPDQGDDWKQVLTKGKAFFDTHIGPGWTPPATP
ncbi:MAG: S9 family peptidase [Hyphomonas sp.]|uniref:alpha/beta hydrolase family protein n=1 Tax=Hyphomonas sp. TaxID=87 RepID=UPI0017E84470|nr:prolyl oligopeptidase family serine peptidase [Hyphomonas sp.]MBA3066890.1 S9 family peptidase [Hyphomonas sp.]MBU4060970.1 prolyl oligopeptidase family serine peptidase [Alphaproteobacteria bacterium]MBU4166178.1 prolyl oligopeptidase family serine peptidase [Alphaproteobacteria bacterium]